MDFVSNYWSNIWITVFLIGAGNGFEHKVEISPGHIRIARSFHKIDKSNVETFTQTVTIPELDVEPQECSIDEDNICLQYGNVARFESTVATNECKNYVYNYTTDKGVSVRFNITGLHLYGGAERDYQTWPVEKLSVYDRSFVSQAADSQAVLEPIWFTNDGWYVYVHQSVPLFYSVDEYYLELAASNMPPYIRNTSRTVLKYTVCKYANIKVAYQHAIDDVFGKPSGPPDYRMIEEPIWSTWAKYKAEINESIVLDFAQSIKQHEFPISQLEIDDNWETCYGSMQIDKKRFPNMKNLVSKLKKMGFRVTMWVHPFVNDDCEPNFSEAKRKGYFVKDKDGRVVSKWWNGRAAYVDFTNPNATEWWQNELYRLQAESGMDAFKFDAGESSWCPQTPIFHKMTEDHPETILKSYVEATIPFGGMIEVRVGRQTQHHPVFVRMLDRETSWTGRLALDTIIPLLLHMNLIGYPFVLPDMVYGNEYSHEELDTELFIRWIQLNAFMPSIQFSIPPWDFGDEVNKITKKFVDLHVKYAPKIYDLMKQATKKAIPVNGPIWWIDPTDNNTFTIDSEFLLGEDLLVAPVLKKGETTRDIYLPKGVWKDEVKGDRIKGPIWLRNYPASIDTLPYFTLIGDASYANSLNPIATFILSMLFLLYIMYH